MIGITIGVNPPFESMAKLASKCFREMTGLDCMMINRRDFERSGLFHPAALKLLVFDLTKENEVLYFDADWFCINPWDLSNHKGNECLYACRDFVLKTDWPDQYHQTDISDYDSLYNSNNIQFAEKMIRADYVRDVVSFSGLKSHCFRWINTGLWLANREHHYHWLSDSLKHYQGKVGHHPDYFEQPAMNVGLSESEIRVSFFQRKYNVLVSTRETWPANLIGLHVKAKRHQEFINLVREGSVSQPTHIKEYFCI